MEHSASATDLLPQVEPELLVATCRPDGQLIDRNRAWKRIFGLGGNLWGHLSQEEQANVLSAFTQAAEGTLVTNTLCTADLPDRDEPVPVLLNFIPVPDRRAHAPGDNDVYAVNITGEVLAEPSTWTPKQTQRHRMEALGRMTMGIAHDFNNLLSALLGHTELLKGHYGDNGTEPPVTESLRAIEHAAADGAILVEKIQRFIRQENESHFEPVDLTSIIEGCIALTKPYWYNEPRRQGIDIEMRQNLEAVPPVHGSATELREVIVNLILNAVQAMPEGGAITFSSRYRPGVGVEIRMSDTGEGMTEEIQEKIFEPLFTTKGNDGSGMGLAVSYGIIQEHDGSVSVTSSPGEGTTFTMGFPPAKPVSETPDTEEDSTSNEAVHILVVDDEQMVRTVLSKLLNTRGHTVDQAQSAEEALSLIEENSYDIVFTDHGMPSMNGRQLAQALHRRWPDLPLVLLTGDTDISPSKEIDRVMSKPFKLESLQNTIQSLVSSA